MRTEPVERTPTNPSRILGLGAGSVALVTAGLYSAIGGAIAAVGLAVFLGGVVVGTRRAVSIGAAALLAGVVYAGVTGAPAVALLVGVGATILAWDAGGFAIDLGAQLGREADATRLEAVHAVAGLAVAVAAASVGYGIYRSVTGGQPVAALLLLLLAGVLLAATLDNS